MIFGHPESDSRHPESDSRHPELDSGSRDNVREVRFVGAGV